MKRLVKICCRFTVVAAVILSFFSAGALLAAQGGPTPQLSVVSKGEEQTGLALTIYNANLGLVKDSRRIALPRGTSEVRFMDVASQIIPTSVHIASLADPQSLSVLEQNYEYDLLRPASLLDKYVGKEVKLVTTNPYTDKEEVVIATLLSNNGGPIFKIGKEITFGHPGRILFPEIPESLISKPTLVWLLRNDGPESRQVEASYLTNGINWRCDYVVTLNNKDDRADMAGWVTIENKSGATYRDAKLKLVAGDVNRVKEDRTPRAAFKASGTVQEAAPQFREEAFFEYHIYTLQRSATVRDNQTKQISLLQSDTVPVKKELVFRGAPFYYLNQYGEIAAKQKVGVFVEIENKKENNLGMPLPKGTVRVYKHDSEGSLQFVGEDAIDHTPEKETITIKVGEAFDVTGSRRMMDWKKLSSSLYEAAYEVSLRNHKKEDVVVKVVEPIPGDWTMIDSSLPFKKTDAFTAEFAVPVAKDSEAKLTYRVRMKY
jgi:hypothetical protein